MSPVADRLETARDAARQRRWHEAHELLLEADRESELSGDDLERLAQASMWSQDPRSMAPYYERAFAAHLAAGNKARAGYVAVTLAHYFGSVRLQRSVGNGWLARAQRLFAEVPEAAEHGYLALQQSLLALNRRDYDDALEFGREAERIARAHGDRSLEVRALQRQGMALIEQGEIGDGKLLLDEAATAALGGEIDAYSTLVVYCNTIGACRDFAAFDEAGQWTEHAMQICEAESLNAFPGMCRINRAEVMRFEGKLAEAEQCATEACEELRDWAPRIASAAMYEIGEVRLRLGDLAKAQEAFDAADELGTDPEPGRSLLLLERGKTAAAFSSIKRVLGDATGLPQRARLLPATVEIAVAAAALPDAEAAAAELAEIADRFGTQALHAAAAQAAGSVSLAAGDADAAVTSLRRAVRLWQEANATYDTGRARLVLGSAYRAVGDDEAASRELTAAGSTFDRLGARLDSERVATLLGRDVGTRVTRTFLFTDIVDSTKTAAALGDAKWTRALLWHDDTLRTIFRANDGEVVDHTGDGFFIAFDDPDQAVDAAIAVQRALAAQGLAPDVRIGIHTAEAMSVAANYRGKGVHEAARIGALGGPGEIVVSRSTLDGRRDVRTSEPRAVELKGLSEPIEVVSIEWR